MHLRETDRRWWTKAPAIIGTSRDVCLHSPDTHPTHPRMHARVYPDPWLPPCSATYGVVYYYSGARARERSLDIAIQKGRLFCLVSHEFSVSTGPPSDQYHNLSRSLAKRHLCTALICLDARLTIVCIFFFFVPMVLPDSKRAAAQLHSTE